MNELTKQQLNEVKRVKNLVLIPAVVLVIFQLFLIYVVLPLKEEVLKVYVASRAGGSSHYLTQEQFILMNSIAIGVALLLAILIFIFAYLKMRKSVLFFSFVLFSATSFYLSIYLSYALEVLWGGWGQLTGIVLSLAIWLVLTWPIMTSGLDIKLRKKNR